MKHFVYAPCSKALRSQHQRALPADFIIASPSHAGLVSTLCQPARFRSAEAPSRGLLRPSCSRRCPVGAGPCELPFPAQPALSRRLQGQLCPFPMSLQLPWEETHAGSRGRTMQEGKKLLPSSPRLICCDRRETLSPPPRDWCPSLGSFPTETLPAPVEPTA